MCSSFEKDAPQMTKPAAPVGGTAGDAVLVDDAKV
jgi:hypothetical protein